MALKPCRECGAEISTEATACPRCGADDPTGVKKAAAEANQKQMTYGCFGCLGFVVIIVFIAMVGGGSGGGSGGGGSAPPASQMRDLNAVARVTGTQLHLTNRDSYPWRNCKIELNSGVIRGGFSTSTTRIDAGETVTAGLMTFTKSGGERFNPMTHAVENVYVHCSVEGGSGSYMGRF